ncbi:hypothetical protein HUN01_33220 [Nostoc edaphicum CCNP1411]|uniref:Uncharacterized protein n=1 Tax=Nostoc edaphicum CCNP1411 TaxID=1472755 RepID=A0A7D7QBH4_9NOSO|nr:hypothetical protein [Nostoc edaphicum]QMS92215.1 hypothetical protein HUN01_33220 [Nostoc edaphicum CCNP1411]
MATIGKYCKAYLVKQFRQYPQWREQTENIRPQKEVVDNRKLTDEDILYLQENYIVTDGIFQDENIIFNDITPEWQDFCHQTLKFELPVYETA